MKRILTSAFMLIMGVVCFAQNDTKVEKNSEHNFEVAKNLDIFNSLYRELDMFYVDTLDANKLVKIGIDAMLESLDPYTVYFAEEDMGDLKMMTTGKYGGIGSVIRLRKDSTVIVYEPYEGMPASVVGLKVGDVIKKIDDKEITKKMDTSNVSELLRGEPGTTFILTIQRPGEKKVRQFKVTRQSIKVPAIPYTGIYGNIGYINLNQFTEGCAKDIRKSVITLKEKGATSIVLDLRGNGGGLLSEAVDIVNLFVPKGIKIVETKGKIANANMTYSTKNEPLDLAIPLVVMVNGNTASAAEIVSGSLQDLDRAVVVGTKTFGKGLVQSPRELPFSGNVKLTTSKYYIPSGRCIQAIDYKLKREGKSEAKDDSLKHIFHTAGGRVVKDGGGIMPDVTITVDTLANMLFYLSNDDVLTDWGTKYMNAHPSLPAVKDFVITDADFEELKKMAEESGFKYDRMSDKRLEELKKLAEFEGYYADAKPEFEALQKKLEHNLSRDFDNFKKDVKRLMALEIVKRYAYQAGQAEESLKEDECFEKAKSILENAGEYKKILSGTPEN